MRLLKLLGFCAFGYLVYQFAQGLLYGAPDMGAGSGGGQSDRATSEDLHRALNTDAGRMNITGQGRGTTVSVDSFDGGRSERIVGRGVITPG